MKGQSTDSNTIDCVCFKTLRSVLELCSVKSRGSKSLLEKLPVTVFWPCRAGLCTMHHLKDGKKGEELFMW